MFLHTRLSRIAGAEVATCDAGPGLVFDSGGAPVVADVSSWGPGFVINGVHHCHGVYAGAPTTLTTTVRAGTLSGSVGLLDWNQACSGTATFKVSQGTETLWRSTSVGPYVDVVTFSVPVTSGALTLTTQLAGDCAAAAWVDLEN